MGGNMPKKRMYADLDGVPYEERLAKGLIHHNFKDITGQRYGQLVAVKPLYSVKGKWIWLFRCDCGAEVERKTADVSKGLKLGHVQACPECVRKNVSEQRRTHGMSHDPLYAVWHSMKLRCFCPTYPAYPRYGARGITVCDRWKDSFENFLADMGPTYQHGLVLDRINNDGNYCPENCHWTTYKANSRNKKGAYSEIDVDTLSRVSGIGKTTLYYRINHGWPLEKLLDPPDRGNSRKEVQDNMRRVEHKRKYTTSSTADDGSLSWLKVLVDQL